jgi:hypothetical protein
MFDLHYLCRCHRGMDPQPATLELYNRHSNRCVHIEEECLRLLKCPYLALHHLQHRTRCDWRYKV